MTGPPLLSYLWVPLISYGLGSIPFGYLLVKVREGRDIRTAGSGNIGAANVARESGLAAGVITLLLDAAKGCLAVWLAAQQSGQSIRWMAVAAVAAVIGHLFPVWLKFRGGRGVATGVGVFLPICWTAVVAALLIWLVMVLFWRYVSLGSVVAAAALPLLVYILYAPGHAPPLAVSMGTILVAVMIIVKHRPNIERLMAGTEPKLKLRRSS